MRVETWMVLLQLVTPVSAVIGMIVVQIINYQKLRMTVADLVRMVDALSPQAAQIADTNLRVAEVQRDILEIKADLATIRKHQQRAADDRPEKGKLDQLKTDKDRQ